MSKKKKIGVLGAGHLGKIHIKLLKESAYYDLVGFYDPDDGNAEKASVQYGAKRFGNMDELIESVEVVDIVTPTLSHYECARKSLERGRHVFIEKPMTSTLEEARQLKELVRQSGMKVQVGHVERYNPAFLGLKDRNPDPRFIESHRLAIFNPRGTDVSVVHDLMIHDLDIILKLVRSEPREVRASGVAVLSDNPDIANARIEFENGCIANVTASRISMKNMRKMRLFQRDAYITIDFLEKKSELFHLSDNKEEGENALELLIDKNGKQKFIRFEELQSPSVNSIQMELEAFARSIEENTEPEVSVRDGFRALELAQRILDEIEENMKRVKQYLPDAEGTNLDQMG